MTFFTIRSSNPDINFNETLPTTQQDLSPTPPSPSASSAHFSFSSLGALFFPWRSHRSSISSSGNDRRGSDVSTASNESGSGHSSKYMHVPRHAAASFVQSSTTKRMQTAEKLAQESKTNKRWSKYIF